MKTITDLIADYGDEFLVCSGDLPWIGTGRIRDEALFYCLDSSAETTVIRRFNLITSKDADRNTLFHTLSGGQKVILMALLALFSPAKRILFHNLNHNLDPEKRVIISGLLEEFSAVKGIIVTDQC